MLEFNPCLESEIVYLGAEEQISKLDKSKEDDEKHHWESGKIFGGLEKGRGFIIFLHCLLPFPVGSYRSQSPWELRHRLVEGEIFEELDPGHEDVQCRQDRQSTGTKMWDRTIKEGVWCFDLSRSIFRSYLEASSPKSANWNGLSSNDSRMGFTRMIM